MQTWIRNGLGSGLDQANSGRKGLFAAPLGAARLHDRRFRGKKALSGGPLWTGARRLLLGAFLLTAAYAATGNWSVVGVSAGTWRTLNEGDGTYSIEISGSWTASQDNHAIYANEAYQGTIAGVANNAVWSLGWNNGQPTQFTNILVAYGTMGSSTHIFIDVIAEGENAEFLGRADVTVQSPPTEYRANIGLRNTSASAVNIQMRRKSNGAILGAVQVDPNATAVYAYSGESDFEVEVIKAVPGASKSGASWVASETGGDALLLTFTPIAYTEGVTNLETIMVDIAGPGAPLTDGAKTIWMSTGPTFDAAVYREGVDKIVSAAQTGGGGAIDGSAFVNTNAILQDVLVATREARDSIRDLDKFRNNAGEQATVAANQHNLQATGAATWADSIKAEFANPSTSVNLGYSAGTGDNFSFGTLNVAGKQLQMKPLDLEGIKTGNGARFGGKMIMNVVRELILWSLALTFLIYCRNELMRFVTATYATCPMTTKTESAQIFIPGAGWGKQITLAGGFVSLLVITITLVIVAMNTGLVSMFSGVTVNNFSSSLAGRIGAAMGTNTGTAMGFVLELWPIGAALELFAVALMFHWGLPVLFISVLTYVKIVHP